MADPRLLACMHRVDLAQKQLLETRTVLEQVLLDNGGVSSLTMLDELAGASFPKGEDARWQAPVCPKENSGISSDGKALRQMADPTAKVSHSDVASASKAPPETTKSRRNKPTPTKASEAADGLQVVEDALEEFEEEEEDAANGSPLVCVAGETIPLKEGNPSCVETRLASEAKNESGCINEVNEAGQKNAKSALRRADSSVHGSAKEEADLIELANNIADDLGILPEDVKLAYKCFCDADADHSGQVSGSELHGLLEAVSGKAIDKNATDRLLQIYDKDSDCEMDFEEFLFCFCHTPHKRQGHLQSAVLRDEDRLDTRSRMRIVGVNSDVLQTFLQKEISEERAFLQIPVIFLLFFFFLLSVILHHQTAVSGALENAVEADIINNANFALAGIAPFENARTGAHELQDIGSFADLWSWVDLGLLPLFFPAGWGTSETRSNIAARCTDPLTAMGGFGWTTGLNGTPTHSTPYGNGTYAPGSGDLGLNLCSLDKPPSFPPELGGLEEYANPEKTPYLMYNEIIAGMRLRQEQLPMVECRKTQYFGRAYKTPCIEVNSWAWLAPDLGAALDINEDYVNQPGGETVYFKSGVALADIRRQLRKLEDKRWANQRTSKIEIAFTVYNNHLDAFVVVWVNFFITRAGHIHKVIKPISVWMNPYSDPLCYVVDVLLILSVMQLFIGEAREIVRLMKDEGVRNGLRIYFENGTEWLDWVSIVYSFLLFAMWGNWLVRVSSLSDLLESADANVKGSWPSDASMYVPSNSEYWDVVDSISRYYQTLKIALAIYPFIIGMRFFEAFGSQPRLGLVTRTLKVAANDIVHFGIVLAITIMIFCVSAEILFGRDVVEFENFGRIYVTVFRALIGDLDFGALANSGRLPAALWMGSFMIFVQMVMLNMLLAIIMDVYSTVKGSMTDEDNFPTMWSQTFEIFRRWNQKRKGLRISIPHIMLRLEQNEDLCYSKEGHRRKPKKITVATFVHMVPGISKTQAERLLSQAESYREATAGTGGTISVEDCYKRLRAVDLRCQSIAEALNSEAELIIKDLEHITSIDEHIEHDLEKK